MYIYTKLNKSNLLDLENMNRYRRVFNPLNIDFFKLYNESNFAQQISLRKRVSLVLQNGAYIGYIWVTATDKTSSIINAMYASATSNSLEIYRFMIKTLENKQNLSYICEKKGGNFEILENLGFQKGVGTIELIFSLENFIQTHNFDIEYETLVRGIHEKLRCRIQNEIFDYSGRVPLDLEDIYFDQEQAYYFDQGSVFMKKGNEYLGYGQLIIENNAAFIVNFGILKKYRGKGYGKIFLNYLLNIAKQRRFDSVNLKVKSDNLVAFQLYTEQGFKITREYYKWELKR